MADKFWLGKRLRTVIAVLLALGVINTQMALALPTGWQVVEGNVSFDQQGSVLNIISQSDKAVVNYITFNLASGETVNFILPNVSSSILNRVIGGQSSSIAGVINANGKIGLVNTAGINIANTAQIHAAALLATTLNIADNDFFENTIQLTKQGNGAGITNAGEIDIAKGGYALIAATGISNSGNIIAEDGSIHLAVGDKVTFHLSNNQSVEVTVDEGIKGLLGDINAAIKNTGSITAHTVELKTRLSENVFANAINNEGVVQATSLASEGGKIALTGDADSGLGVLLNSGSLLASGDDQNAVAGKIHIKSNLVVNSGKLAARGETGATGGHVEVLGDVIYNIADASIDVSGDTGGGTALIGGDFQGTGDTYRSKVNFTDGTVQINADARTSGDGGKIIFWADDETYFYGDIKARGGELAGNGGFAEVSGKEYLDFYGWADLTAKNGTRGQLLLDPDNITIVSFDPASLNAVMHLDGSDSSTMSLTGASVNTWNDATANGKNMTAAGANRPTLVAGAQNGLSIVRFDGSNDYMTSNALGIGSGSDFTNVALLKVNSFTNGGTNDGSGSYIMDRTPATNNLNSLKAVGGKFFFQKRFNDGSGLGGPASTSNINTSAYQLVQWDRDVGTAFNMWVDGVNESSVADAGGALTPPDIRMGSHFSTSGNPGMDMAEYFIFNKQLSTVERQSLEQSLFGKWNVNVSTAKLNSTYLSGTNSVLVDTYLEQLSQTADINLLANQNITVADLSDNMLALGGQNFTLTATNGNITFADLNDTIRTEGGDITMTAGGTLSVGHLNTTGASGVVANGNINLTGADGVSFNSLTTNSGNVTLTADGNTDGVGNIVWDAAMAAAITANGGDLRLNAENVTLSTNLSSGGGNVTIEADYNNDGAGTVNFNGGTVLNSAGGDISISGDQLLLDSAGAGIVAGAGNVLLVDDGATNNNDIRLNNGFTITGANLTATSNHDFFMYNNSDINMTGTITVTVGDDIITDNGDFTAVGNINLNANDTVDIRNVTSTGGTITLSADHDNSGAGNVNIDAGNVLNANGNDITLLGQTVNIAENINTAGGDLFVTANRSGSGTGNVDINNNASINTAGGNATLAGDQVLLDGGAGSSLTTGAGDIFLVDNGANNNNDVRLNNGFTMSGRNLDVDSNHGFYVLGGSSVSMTGITDIDTVANNFIVDASTMSSNGVFTADVGNIIDIRNGSNVSSLAAMTLNAADSLEVDGSTVNSTGAFIGTAGNDVNMYNNGVVQSTTTINMTAADNFNGNNGVFSATGDITLTANDTMDVMDVTTTAGNIVLNADQDLDGTGNFTLQAGNNIQTNGGNLTIRGENITLNDDIQSVGGDVTLVANRDALGVGQIQMNAGTTINTANGNLDMTSADFYFDGTGGSTITVGTGNVTITENNSTDANDIRFNNGFSLTANNITMNAFNDIQIDNASVITANGFMDLTAGDEIFIRSGSLVTATGVLDAVSANNFNVDNGTLNATGALTATSTTLDVNMSNNGTISSASSITVTAGDDVNGNNGIFTATGDVTLNAVDHIDVMDVTTTAGNIAINADQNLDGIGNFTLQAGNNILTNGGNLAIRGENITLNADINSAGGDVTLTANRDAVGLGVIDFNSGADILTANGDLGMTAADFLFDGTGGSTINVGNGDITITENNSTDADDIRFYNGFVLAGNNITLNAVNDILLQNDSVITAAGTFTATAGDDIDAGNGNITANGGNIQMLAGDHLTVREVTVSQAASSITLRADENVDGTGNVTIQTGNNLNTNNGNVTLMGEQVILNDDIATNGGDVTITANRDGAGAQGYINFNNDADIDTNNGDINMTAARFFFNGTGLSGLDAGTGNVTITENGTADDEDLRFDNAFFVRGNNLIATSNHDIDVLNNADIDMDGTVTMTAGDEINGQTGSIAAVGDITLNANSHIDVMNVVTTTGDIVISADHDVSGAGNFTLNVGANINTNGGDLTVLGENITLNQDIVTAGGDVTLTANRDNAGGEGQINFNNSADIATNNGDINLTGADFLFDGTGVSGLASGLGDITITENGFVDGNDVRFNNAFTVTGRNLTINAAHDVDLFGGSSINMSGLVNITANDDMTLTSGSITAGTTLDLTATDNINANGSVLLATGNVTLRAGDDVQVSDVTTTTGNIILAADEDLDSTGNFTLQAGTNINSNGGDIDILGENITLNDFITSAGGDVDITADRAGAGAGDFNMNNGGSGIITAGGNINITGDHLRLNGNAGVNWIDAGAGDITITETASADNDDVRFYNAMVMTGRNININAANDIVMEGDSVINSSGIVNMTAGDDINNNAGDITAATDITLTAADTITIRDMTSTGGGNISILADQNLDGTGNLTVSAGDNIVTNGGNLVIRAENVTIQEVIDTDGGDITMQANRDNAGAEGAVNFDNSASLTTDNGDVLLSGADIILNNAGFINAGTGDVTLTENGTVDGNDLIMNTGFAITGRHIDMDSNADIVIQGAATITASGNITMDAADQIVANGGGLISAAGNIIGNAGGTIAAGDMTAAQNLGLVGAGDVTIVGGGVTAQGNNGWNGAADETLVVWSTGGDVLGSGFTASGAGNIRLQAGSTGNLGAGFAVDVDDVHASQNASFYASGNNGGRAIRVDGNSDVAGWIRASGFNAANNLTGANGEIILQMNTGNLTTGLAWSNSSNITLTTNNGSILQDPNGYPWGPGAFWGKTIFTGNGGDISLTANGGAGSYISTGANALGVGSNLTARASGESGTGRSVQLYGRVDGNMTVYNTSGVGNAVTGDVYLGTSIGADPNNLNDVYTVQDVVGNTSIRAFGDVGLYGSFQGTVSLYNTNSVTAVVDKESLLINTISATNDVNLTSLRGVITGGNITSGGDINLQAGSQWTRDKMSYVTLNNLNATGNLDVVVGGSTNGGTSGNSIVITGSSVGGASTGSHIINDVFLGTVIMP